METNWQDGYYFYVLSLNEDGTTNLIMDRNIYYDSDIETGRATDSISVGEVLWQYSFFNVEGPVTAMDYLYNSTKDWENVPNVIIDYKNEGKTENFGYESIITFGTTTKIIKFDGTEATVLTDQKGYENIKARMPYSSEISNYSTSNAYLYDNMQIQCYELKTDEDGEYRAKQSCDAPTIIYREGVMDQKITHIDGISYYWTLSSGLGSGCYVVAVRYDGFVYDDKLVSTSGGVRPVITLRI